MNTSEILTSIQTQLAITLPSEDIKEPTTFYNDLISEMDHADLISSFLIGVNTNTGGNQESNLTIISFEDTFNLEHQADIERYLELKINSGHEYDEYTFMGNQLIISFDY